MPRIKTTAIIPAKFDIAGALALLADGVQTEGETQQAEYEKTTRTWRNKPQHELEFSRTKQKIQATNITDNEIYYFMHNGTVAHEIKPKTKPLLIFKEGYRAKTVPGQLNSRQGGSFGKTVGAKAVEHPGTDAREWTDVIIRKRKRPYKRNMQNVMKTIASLHNKQRQIS